nr:transposase [Anoxybacter fermentans]
MKKYDPTRRNSGNSRNGYYTRSFKTKYGNIRDLKVPRDRNGEFKTVLFELYQRCDNWLEEIVCQRSQYQRYC